MEELLTTIVDALSAQVPAREAQALRDALDKWRGSASTGALTQGASAPPQPAPAEPTVSAPPVQTVPPTQGVQ